MGYSQGSLNFNRLGSLPGIQKYLIVCVILLIVALFVGLKLLMPSLNEFVAIKSLVNDKKTLLLALDSKINDLKTTDNTDIVKIADKYLQAVPHKNMYLNLFDGIKILANSNTVTIDRLELSPGIVKDSKTVSANQTESVNPLKVSAEISGSFDAIFQMVADLGNTLPYIEVTELSFDKKFASDSATMTKLVAKVALVTYWAELPEFLDKIDTPLQKLTKDDYDFYSRLENYKQLPLAENVENGNDPVSVGRDNPFPI